MTRLINESTNSTRRSIGSWIFHVTNCSATTTSINNHIFVHRYIYIYTFRMQFLCNFCVTKFVASCIQWKINKILNKKKSGRYLSWALEKKSRALKLESQSLQHIYSHIMPEPSNLFDSKIQFSHFHTFI